MHSSLISTQIAQDHLDNPKWRFFDCRYELTAPEKKKAEFAVSHIPGALYVHMNQDLAATHVPGKTGRHPLPSVDDMARKFSAIGIDKSIQVAVYDDAGGSHAARFWWMLRWLGHDAVAVIDGGWSRWIKEERPVSSDLLIPETKEFIASPRLSWTVTADAILKDLNNPETRVLDARSAQRFRGENEKFDPVAGHIPGAHSAPFTDNLDENGNWESKSELRQKFENLLDGSHAEEAVSYCGSGITACHNILAMYHAGLGDSRLYPGSWSEWITDPERPVE